MKSLAEFIQKHREKAGLSITGLANKTNIKPEILDDIESGKELFLSVTQRQQIARVLKISPKELKEYERSYEFQEIPDDVINNIKIQNEDYKYCMCILMEDDSLDSSNKLNTTLTGISLNLKSLEDNLEIIPQNICLFIFVKSILNNKLFDDSEKGNLDEGNKNFIIKDKTISYESSLRNVKMYVVANANGLYEMRSLRCYYSILKEISKDKYMIFSSIITAGVMPVQDSLLSLIKIAYNNKKNHGIAIAPIEYTPVNIYSNIALYEKIHFNIFNMSLYAQSCSPPISSLFCTMFINNNILNILNEFREN